MAEIFVKYTYDETKYEALIRTNKEYVEKEIVFKQINPVNGLEPIEYGIGLYNPGIDSSGVQPYAAEPVESMTTTNSIGADNSLFEVKGFAMDVIDKLIDKVGK